MSSKGDEQRPQGLTCPLCLESFKNPTLLRCGHTFCRVCLENYDQQHNANDHIECPVCRKRTKLEESRISGLSPNFSLKGLQEELLREEGLLPNICALHENEYKNIFCKVCKNFICITCFISNHEGHQIVSKRNLKDELKKRKDTLFQESEEKTSRLEISMQRAQEQKDEMHHHCNDMETEIKDAFAKKVQSLQKNEKELMMRVHAMRRNADIQLDRYIANIVQLKDRINSSVATLKQDASEDLKPDLKENMLILHHLKCIDLENLMRKPIDEQDIARVQAALNSKFHSSSMLLLNLHVGHIRISGNTNKSTSQQVTCTTSAPVNTEGHIVKEGTTTGNKGPPVKTAASETRQGEKATSSTDSQHAKMTSPVNGNTDELKPTTSNMGACIPAAASNNSPTVKKHYDLVYGVKTGMAALSHNSVVLCYGRSKPGADCFSLSDDEKPYLQKEVGQVGDITILSDGRSVASHNRNMCRVYDANGVHIAGVQYTLLKSNSFPKLCSDQQDNVYAVNGNAAIYIFRGSVPEPQTVIPTRGVKPKQICVTKTGVLITSTCNTTPSTITLFDREGHRGSYYTGRDHQELLYAAVDTLDRVLVARVRCGSPELILTRYTLQGMMLIKETAFRPCRLTYCLNQWDARCYLASPSPNLVAFVNSTELYFIELPV